MGLGPSVAAAAPAIGVDRRRHRRIAVEGTVRLATIDAEHDPASGRPFFRAFEERCVNVSRGGLLVRSHEPVAPGRRLLLEVALPGAAPFEVVARVAWAGRAERDDDAVALGIAFVGGAGDALLRLGG